MKSKFVKVEDMDFVTGLDEVIADTYDEPPPKNIWEKFWLWIVSAIFICRSFLFEPITLLIRIYSSRRPRARSVQRQLVGLPLPSPANVGVHRKGVAVHGVNL